MKFVFTTGNMVDSSPLVSSTGVFIGSEDDSLYSLDWKGSERWSFNTSGAIHSSFDEPSLDAEQLACNLHIAYSLERDEFFELVTDVKTEVKGVDLHADATSGFHRDGDARVVALEAVHA